MEQLSFAPGISAGVSPTLVPWGARRKAGLTGVQRKFRLSRSTDFKRVRRFGKSYAHPLVVLVALRQENLPGVPSEPFSRVGVAAGRSVGNAVQRNRAKRRLRAALLPHLPVLDPGWDVILIARRPLIEADFTQLQTALASLLIRARLETNLPVTGKK